MTESLEEAEFPEFIGGGGGNKLTKNAWGPGCEEVEEGEAVGGRAGGGGAVSEARKLRMQLQGTDDSDVEIVGGGGAVAGTSRGGGGGGAAAAAAAAAAEAAGLKFPPMSAPMAHLRMPGGAGAQFTCFTSTTVQILTPEELRARASRHGWCVWGMEEELYWREKRGRACVGGGLGGTPHRRHG
jgi:hypothetical protein